MPLRRFCHLQVVAAEARSKELQEELTATYKEKSRLAEELVQASRQLQIVRDSNEAQVTHAFHPNIACKQAKTCGAWDCPGHASRLLGITFAVVPAVRAK